LGLYNESSLAVWCLARRFAAWLGLTLGVPATHRILVPVSVAQCEAATLEEIVGYTAITSTSVSGDFEGADFDKVVKMDNGMIFEFMEYKYAYAYHPDVIVFAHVVTKSRQST
jgi:hypothetical protein